MTRKAIAPVVDGDAVLRLLEHADLADTMRWRNHADSRRWFHTSDPISGEQHRAWFDAYLQRADDYVFVLEIDGTRVAQASLYDVDATSAEFGRLLVDPTRRGAGVSHRAIALCLRVADDSLRLKRVHLEVKRANTRAIRAYANAGFRDIARPARAADSIVMERRVP